MVNPIVLIVARKVAEILIVPILNNAVNDNGQSWDNTMMRGFYDVLGIDKGNLKDE